MWGGGGGPHPTIQTSCYYRLSNVRHHGGQRTFKPKNPEEYKWKVNRDDAHDKKVKSNPSVGHLLNKYVHRGTVSKNWLKEKCPWSPLGQTELNMKQRDATRPRDEL
jgi:hypothetical protein